MTKKLPDSFCSLSLHDSSLLILGLKFVGSLLKVMFKTFRNLFMPFTNESGVHATQSMLYRHTHANIIIQQAVIDICKRLGEWHGKGSVNMGMGTHIYTYSFIQLCNHFVCSDTTVGILG